MENLETNEWVLVTGGTGFIGVHIILNLLQKGYKVRTTLRSLNRKEEVMEMLKTGGITSFDNLRFIEADLTRDTNWDEAAKDCQYVMHVASPTPLIGYSHEDELIIPAKEGVLRVLKAARSAGVQRVVLTSAFGAIGFGCKRQTTPYTETDWTVLNDSVPPYQKSKTIAEQAAWNFVATEGSAPELAAVNPVTVLGPVLGTDYSHSIHFIQNMLNGKMALGCPKINSAFVDVRDVAELHWLAMTHPAAKGERFLAAAGESVWFADIAKILKKHFGSRTKNISSKELPNWLVHLAAIGNPSVKMLLPMLERMMNVSNEKAKHVLGWNPRSTEEAAIATAESLIKLRIVK
jgi:dihydroflavonol-4-reductase